MKKTLFFFSFVMLLVLSHADRAEGQADSALHVVKSGLVADTDVAELCLEFDKPLAPLPAAKWIASIKLEEDGKNVAPQNIVPTSTSVCVFPLTRGSSYQLTLNTVHGALGEKLATPYITSFSVPDRAPFVAFDYADGLWATFEKPKILRTVNVQKVHMEIYHVTDRDVMAHLWADRSQMLWAPTETAFAARSKGIKMWEGDEIFEMQRNKAAAHPVDLHLHMPDPPAGLYALIVEAGARDEPTNPGLAPLAVMMFTKSDFMIQAVADKKGTHIFASTPTGPKNDASLTLLDDQGTTLTEMQSAGDGTALFAPNGGKHGQSVMAVDKQGNVAFKDVVRIAPLQDEDPPAETPRFETHTLPERGLLTVTTESDDVTALTAPVLHMSSVTEDQQAAPLVGGHWAASWQKRDAASLDYANYIFGAADEHLVTLDTMTGDFLTDMQGHAQIKSYLPKLPVESGLYQAVIKIFVDDGENGKMQTLSLPLRSESIVVGIKPLAPGARFVQNGLARFAVIALAGDDKPRDAAGLSFRIYEEGRSFDWYQDGGHWNYKREPQLRLIGAGELTIKGDASTVIEWPVTAGNYRLEIRDAANKLMAQSGFSSGSNALPGDTNVVPLKLDGPELSVRGREVTFHTVLTAPSMVTALVNDGEIRKSVHEFHPAGDFVLSFVPGSDWQRDVGLSLDALSLNSQSHGLAELKLNYNPSVIPNAVREPALTLAAFPLPDSLALHSGDRAALQFDINNNTAQTDTYHYEITAPAAVTIEGERSGTVTLLPGARHSVSLILSSDQVGTHDFKFDVTGIKSRITRSWQIACLPLHDGLHSLEAPLTLAPQQTLAPIKAQASAVFVARRPAEGLAEHLSVLIKGTPFTVQELAWGVQALRMWGETVTTSTLAPSSLVHARLSEWRSTLLSSQNRDGGFGVMRGSLSTIEDTATAIMALAPETQGEAVVSRSSAIGWLKQKLANSWIDEAEHAPRAIAYAALADADALDAASLRYFSDISAATSLPPEADAFIAASFKHLRDPDAAAFWIKKMLESRPDTKNAALLAALAATDALSSDDVHAVLRDTGASLRRGEASDFIATSQILRALYADGQNAGKWHVTLGGVARDVLGITSYRISDVTGLRSGDQTLGVVLASEGLALPVTGSQLTRHVYHINGVELPVPKKPTRREIYMIEITGSWPKGEVGQRVLLQDSDVGLTPLGCPVSPQTETLSFIPWFSPKTMTQVDMCLRKADGLDLLLTHGKEDGFKLVYFAMLNSRTVAALAPPSIRVLK